ncbi:hypothetical protein [Streptomyces sp. MJP52]|uniref:hypothetical protein n=1 Tax=Streptomyces sp. MJP52 TaxID=2940555 RepID=UPI0024734D9E|nr:hypothetical protein [Streptomyces sp. MJP52]MDH6225470.1 hypothetical protein [Streptomyces sp. MJP52]
MAQPGEQPVAARYQAARAGVLRGRLVRGVLGGRVRMRPGLRRRRVRRSRRVGRGLLRGRLRQRVRHLLPAGLRRLLRHGRPGRRLEAVAGGFFGPVAGSPVAAHGHIHIAPDPHEATRSPDRSQSRDGQRVVP